MAKLTGPLFSLQAGGSIGPRLTYSQRKSGAQVRVQKAQLDVITADRSTERGYFQDSATAWGTLSDDEKSQWNVFNAGG